MIFTMIAFIRFSSSSGTLSYIVFKFNGHRFIGTVSMKQENKLTANGKNLLHSIEILMWQSDV